MGFGKSLSRIFGFSRDKTNEQEYEGARPPSSLTEVQGGPEYYKTLQDRMAGIGVGYTPGFLDKATAPYATARKSYLENYELPQINAQASARGLGRSSVITNQQALKRQEAGQDIESRIADVGLKNEQQMRDEINNAVSGMGTFASNNANLATNRAMFDYGDKTRVLNNTATNIANQDQNAMKLPTLGASAAMGPVTGGASLMSMPSVLGGGQVDMNTAMLYSMYAKNSLNKNPAQVNIGGSGVTSDYLKNYGKGQIGNWG
jgi:hypothetical protein